MDYNFYEAFLELVEKKKKRIASKKPISMKDIGRKGHHIFECEAFTYLQQHNSPEKYFVFERLKRIRIDGIKANPNLKEDDIEYRICYYIVGKIGTKKNKWTFGQYCPTIPPEDFEKLVKKAPAYACMTASLQSILKLFLFKFSHALAVIASLA